MRDRLVDILDRLDATLARTVGVVPSVELDPTARLARRIRNRLDFPTDLALVALAGGTGSGKSSLFNAILGGEKAEVGGIRPTTSRVLASVPRTRGGEVDGYLSALGDLDVVRHEGLPWLVLLDLPDTDSVVVDHRLMVDNLLPAVDAVVWVADVEKYRSNILHQGYLVRLKDHESQFSFVLNQIDRVPRADIPALEEDFRSALAADGFADPSIFLTSAGSVLNPPAGIDELVGHLEVKADGLAIDRALVDLHGAVGQLTGWLGADSMAFEQEWDVVLSNAVDMATSGEPVAAARAISAFFLEIADGLFGEGADTALSIAAHVSEVVSEADRASKVEVPVEMARRGWARSGSPVDRALQERRVWLRGRIDESTGEQMRPVLAHRATARASLVGLAVELAAISRPIDD